MTQTRDTFGGGTGVPSGGAEPLFGLVLVKYGEIALKGKNRSAFENSLIRNMKAVLEDFPDVRITREFGRAYVEFSGDWRPIADRLKDVFGVVSFSPAARAKLSKEDILETSLRVIEDHAKFEESRTFKVDARRAYKEFPWESPEINREVGAYLIDKIPDLKVDVHNPSMTLTIEVREDGAYIYSRSLPGPGGLPVGISNKALLLLSGGIDSPVAGWMSMKRGLRIDALHFYSFPFTGEKSRQKVIDLCSVLSRYSGGKMRLFVAYFTEIQKAIQMNCPESLRVTIMRRMMFRIAEKLARKEGILALSTGESLGQVASQTLESIAAINDAVSIPVLRPLIGLDKEEIVERARKIGTYEISIRPYEDCCTIFAPRRPSTRPNIEMVREAEEGVDWDALIQEALDKTELLVIGTEGPIE